MGLTFGFAFLLRTSAIQASLIALGLSSVCHLFVFFRCILSVLSVVIMPDVVTDSTKRYKVPEKWRPANIVR